MKWITLGLALSTALGLGPEHPTEGDRPMQMKKLTPILVVEEIEPILPFWVDRLGFTKVAEVPQDDRIGFVILARDGVEVMYQSRASVEADVPGILDGGPLRGAGALFIEVADIDAIEKALEGIEVAVPRRKTFYGADEIFVRDPAGNLVGFAEMAEAGGAE